MGQQAGSQHIRGTSSQGRRGVGSAHQRDVWPSGPWLGPEGLDRPGTAFARCCWSALALGGGGGAHRDATFGSHGLQPAQSRNVVPSTPEMLAMHHRPLHDPPAAPAHKLVLTICFSAAAPPHVLTHRMLEEHAMAVSACCWPENVDIWHSAVSKCGLDSALPAPPAHSIAAASAAAACSTHAPDLQLSYQLAILLYLPYTPSQSPHPIPSTCIRPAPAPSQTRSPDPLPHTMSGP